MAEVVEELVISARPKGLDDTTDGLMEMEEQIDESADAMGDAADEFEGMQTKFEGATGAIVAGVAVAVGGILSQVPILGAAADAFATIVSGIGFQVDQLIRDLGGEELIRTLNNIGGAIFEAEGILGDLAAIFGVVGAAIGSYISFATLAGAATGGMAGAASAFSGALSSLAAPITAAVTWLAGILGVSLGVAAAIGVAIAAVVGFIAAYITNFAGVRDKTDQFLADIGAAFGTLLTKAKEELNALWNAVKTTFSNITESAVGEARKLWVGVVSWFTDLIDSARSVGGDIFEALAGALRGLGEAIATRVVAGLNSLISLINQAIRKLPDRVRSELGISTISQISTESLGLGSSSGGSSGGSNNTVATRQNNNIFLDGRRVDGQTGRYRDDETSRRGTF